MSNPFSENPDSSRPVPGLPGFATVQTTDGRFDYMSRTVTNVVLHTDAEGTYPCRLAAEAASIVAHGEIGSIPNSGIVEALDSAVLTAWEFLSTQSPPQAASQTAEVFDVVYATRRSRVALERVRRTIELVQDIQARLVALGVGEDIPISGCDAVDELNAINEMLGDAGY